MALIKVGIHENLTLSSKTKINEHGTLELVIASAQSSNALMDAFTSNSTLTSMESSIRFYPPNMKDFEQKAKSASEVGKDLLLMRHQFMQYGLIFATKEKVEAAIGGTAMFEGLGIPPEEMAKALAMLTREDFVQKVTTNLSTKFLKLLTESNAFSGTTLFRQKFLRQSKDKNYAVIPTSDFDTWIESMDIPKNASKIAYSKWEVENGKNDPDPVAGDASQSTDADKTKAADLFSGGAQAAAPAQANPFLSQPANTEAPTGIPNLTGGLGAPALGATETGTGAAMFDATAGAN